MNFRYFLLVLIIPAMMICCEKPDSSTDNQKDPDTETPVNPDNNDPAPAPPIGDDLAPEVKDGDMILVTNADVQKFLEDVHYNDHDYSHSDLISWAETNNVPVCPGKSTYKPQSYTIRWEADPSAGEVSVTLSEGSWSRVYTVKAGGSNVEITNLCPNVHYTYEAKAGDKVLTQGGFDTYGLVRQLYVKTEIRNCRDLGGWYTADGKMVRYRMIYRGGRLDPSSLATSGKEHFKAEGIKAQLDLRHTSDVLTEDESPLKELFDDYEFCAPLVKEGYSYLLKSDQEKARQAVQFIMDCVDKNKPVYFHCSLGRDRTGTIAMVILGLLGVPEGDVSKEYELTQFAPHGWATSTGEKTKMTRLADYDGAANYIWDNFVDETAGETFADGCEKYLISIGISQEDIDKFRANMLV